MEIPENIPKPDLSLLKSENPASGNDDPNKQVEAQTTPPRDNLWKHFLNFQPDGNQEDQNIPDGTISTYLPSAKHTISPADNNTEHKKKKIIPEVQINDDMDNIDNYNMEDEDTTDNTDNTTDDTTRQPIRTPSIDNLLSETCHRE